MSGSQCYQPARNNCLLSLFAKVITADTKRKPTHIAEMKVGVVAGDTLCVAPTEIKTFRNTPSWHECFERFARDQECEIFASI